VRISSTTTPGPEPIAEFNAGAPRFVASTAAVGKIYFSSSAAVTAPENWVSQ